MSPLKPNMWSNDRFSSIEDEDVLDRGVPPCRTAGDRDQAEQCAANPSHATQTSLITQASARHTAFTTQANALHTHFATQYQALQTHLATQYHALQTHFATQYQAAQKKPATQFQGVYQWHSSHEVHCLSLRPTEHSFEPLSAHCEHWLEPSSAQVVHS